VQRQRLHELVQQERVRTAQALGERGEAFARLKVEGILESAELWAVVLMPERERHVFGRRTLPEMDVASAACAIQNLWLAARAAGLASANVHLLTDMIACPGGDFCALANARSIPIAEAITERYQDLDELDDLGEIDLHISGCINSCGHHHSGHIGILGVDKDGKEWYQVTLGGSDGSALSGAPQAGKVVGPSFSAAEVPGVIEAVLTTYRDTRENGENFIDTLRRVGPDPFKAAANGARFKVEEAA